MLRDKRKGERGEVGVRYIPSALRERDFGRLTTSIFSARSNDTTTFPISLRVKKVYSFFFACCFYILYLFALIFLYEIDTFSLLQVSECLLDF